MTTEKDWYVQQLLLADPRQEVASYDQQSNSLSYSPKIRSDESLTRRADTEELVRALALALLRSNTFNYPLESFYIEKYYKHGHPSSKHDEVDLLILDPERLPFAMWEFKTPSEYDKQGDEYIRYQLFGTAPLVGAPKLLVFATIRPLVPKPDLDVVVIDYSRFRSFETWTASARPHARSFPYCYSDPLYVPYVNGGRFDLRHDCTHADFRAAAAIFHSEFFSEHPDNMLFSNLLKCLLAKIYDERQTKKGDTYGFQIYYDRGTEETADSVYHRVNQSYRTAYTRYIDPGAAEPDEINAREFRQRG